MILNLERGYKLEIQNVTNCGGEDQVFTSLNHSLKIDQDCDVSSKSCVLMKPYKTYTVHLTVSNSDSGMVLAEKRLDMCKKDGNQYKKNFILHLAAIGLPAEPKCPSNETFVHCYNGTKVFRLPPTIQRMLPLFAVNRQIRVSLRLQHDSGSSCFNLFGSYMKM